MNKLKSSWNWIKNHIEAINFGVVIFIVIFMTWFSVHTLNVETELRMEKEFLMQELVRTQDILGNAVDHINNQHSSITNQQQLINAQNTAIEKLVNRIKYLEAVLNGDIT